MPGTLGHKHGWTAWLWRIAWAAITAVALLLLFASPAGTQSLNQKISKQQQELNKIQKDIERHRNEAKKLKREESNVVKQLASVDKEINLANQFVKGLNEREQLLEQQIDSLRASVAYEGATLDIQKIKLAARLRQMYKRGRHYEWEVLLAGGDMHEVVRRYKFLGMIAERDANLVTTVANRKQSLEVEQASLTMTMADVAALKSIRAHESKKLETSKTQRVAMLTEIRAEKGTHDQAIDELKAAQERLKNLIGDLEARRLAEGDEMADLPTGDFAALKGRLIQPVEGKVVKRFGKDRHPEFGTVTFNNGIDIQAPSGAPIRAVADGRVEFVDWISGYGNCIILNHGGGYYTLYAHASQMFVRTGQSIRARDVIAEVGDSGSLNGYECHFEIRKSKEALNPSSWLKK